MTRAKRLARNPRLLFWIRTLFEFKILNAIIVLFYLERGVEIEQIYYLSIAYAVGSMIFEIPSGYMADKIGRKRVLMIGILAMVATHAVNLFAYGFPTFIIAFVLVALAYSAFSGTEEALLYDSLKEIKKENTMTKESARLGSARHLPKIFIPFVGAVIAQNLQEWQFDLLISVNIVFVAVGVILVLMLIEPKRFISLKKTESLAYIQTLKVIWKSPFLMKAAMNSSLVFSASYIAFRTYQPYLDSLGASVLVLGIFYVLIHGLSFALKWNIDWLLQRISIPNLLHVTIGLMIMFGVIAAVSQSPALVFISLLSFIILTNLRQPLFTQAMNMRIESHQRATTLSNLSIVHSIMIIPIFLVVGMLAKEDLQYPLWIALALAVLVAMFFTFKSKELN